MSEQNPVVELDLYLIRHAESFGNIEAELPDDPVSKNDPELTEKGVFQAECIGSYFKDAGFDAVFSSPLRRAVRTAGEICKNNGKPLQLIPDLTEIWVEPGYDGVGLKELDSICPGCSLAGGYDIADGFLRHDGEDESLMFERAGNFLEYIRSRFKNGEKIAAVSHAGILTYIIFYIIGYRDKEPNYDFRLTNTGVTHIIFYKEGTNRYGDVIFDCVNERRHLPE